MDREGAETYLRLLAEAAMRGSLAPAAPRAPNASTILVAGHALTAVGALDPVTVEEILTDFRLAVTVRQLHSEPWPGPRPGRDRGPVARPGPGRPAPETAPGPGAGNRDARGRNARGRNAWGRDARGGRRPGPGRPVRPVGLTVPFHAGAVSGELCLMSFAQTGTGARFIAGGRCTPRRWRSS